MKKLLILYIVLLCSTQQLWAQEMNRLIFGIETIPVLRTFSNKGVLLETFTKVRFSKLPLYGKLGVAIANQEDVKIHHNLYDVKMNGFALKSGLYFHHNFGKKIGFFAGGNYVYSKANLEGIFELDARYWETYESALSVDMIRHAFEGELGLEAKIVGGFFVSSSLKIVNFSKFRDYQLNDPENQFYYDHIPGLGDINSNEQNVLLDIQVTLLYKLF